MSSSNEQDLLKFAKEQEQQMNSYENKQGRSSEGVHQNDDSGVNEGVESRFDGASVTTGSTGASNNREIPDEEGGEINPNTGRQTKAGDFEGMGGPEDKIAAAEAARGGDQDVQGNVRQQ